MSEGGADSKHTTACPFRRAGTGGTSAAGTQRSPNGASGTGPAGSGPCGADLLRSVHSSPLGGAGWSRAQTLRYVTSNTTLSLFLLVVISIGFFLWLNLPRDLRFILLLRDLSRFGQRKVTGFADDLPNLHAGERGE